MDPTPGHFRLRAWLYQRRWLALGLLILYLLPRLAFHQSFQGHDYDLGIYHNLAFNLAHGNGFYSDVLGYSHLAEHWNPVMLAFAPCYRLWPSAHWLMAAQALAATATVLALVWLADHHLRELPERRRRWATWTIIGLCVVYRPLASAWWFSFQPILLGSPGIAWALVFLHLGRWWPLVAAVTLALASREAAILSCLGLAWYAWMVARRPRAALAIAAAALATAALVFLVVMPWAQAYQGWGHAKRLGASGDPVGKIRYLVTTLGCAAFLPLAAPLAALAALPGMALNLSVTMANQYSGGFHYQAHIAVFLLAAAIQGTAHLLHHLPPGSRWLRWGWPMAAVLALAIALGDALPLRKFVTSLDPRPWISGARLAGDLERALAQIGDDIPLAADPKLGPHMARRYRSLKDLERRGTLEQVPSGMLLVVRHTWWEALSVDKTLVIPVSTEGQIDILRRR